MPQWPPSANARHMARRRTAPIRTPASEPSHRSRGAAPSVSHVSRPWQQFKTCWDRSATPVQSVNLTSTRLTWSIANWDAPYSVAVAVPIFFSNNPAYRLFNNHRRGCGFVVDDRRRWRIGGPTCWGASDQGPPINPPAIPAAIWPFSALAGTAARSGMVANAKVVSLKDMGAPWYRTPTLLPNTRPR